MKHKSKKHKHQTSLVEIIKISAVLVFGILFVLILNNTSKYRLLMRSSNAGLTKEQPTPSSEEVLLGEVETPQKYSSQLETYKNDKYGISFNYPNNLVLDEMEEGDYYHYIFSLNTDKNTNSCNSILSLFYFDNNEDTTLESFFDNFNKNIEGGFPIDYKNATITQIGGNKAYFVEEMCEPCPGYCGRYYFKFNKNIYGLTIHKTEQELDDVLSTFKFTK